MSAPLLVDVTARPQRSLAERRMRWLLAQRLVPTWQRWSKRAFDIVASAVLLVAFAPLMLLVAFAVRASSAGPVIFSQMRVGKGGRLFRFYKFRTMLDGAHLLHQHVAHLNECDGPALKIASDPRHHAFGPLLRRWSLDELPQLWNVLRGDMSLVGPRPALPHEVDDYQPHYFQRLTVMPGLTGLWQVSGRANVPFRRWMAMDVWYAHHWNFSIDLWLLLRTIPAVLRKDGAW